MIDKTEKLISFNVVSLFPSVPVDLVLTIIVEMWEEVKELTNITKGLFLRILRFCIKDNRHFQYDDKLYSQKMEHPMGSPASPIATDIVMERLLETSSQMLTIKHKILTNYVDDLFAIIRENEIDNTLTITFIKEVHYGERILFQTSISGYHRDKPKRGKLRIDWY